MKKIFTLLAAMLCCYPLYSQESEASGGPSLTVVSRLEGNPVISLNSKGDNDFSMGWSSLYTIFEGDLNDHLSYSVINHWLSTSPEDLYKNTFRSDDINWVDKALLTYTTNGPLSFSLGKDMYAMGTFELDAYDFDTYLPTASVFWNNSTVYQWGGSVSYTPNEDHTLTFQVTSSPFSEKPFQNGLLTYNLYWNGQVGPWHAIYSTNLMEYDRGNFIHVLALGNQFELGDWTLTLDYVNKASSASHFFDRDMSLLMGVNYNIRDQWELFLKGGYEFVHHGFDNLGDGYFWELDGGTPTGISKDYGFIGGGVTCYPLKNSQDLRLHGVVSFNNYSHAMQVSVGATYYWQLL